MRKPISTPTPPLPSQLHTVRWEHAPTHAELAREGAASFFERLGAWAVARALRAFPHDELRAAAPRLRCHLRALAMPERTRWVALSVMEAIYEGRAVAVVDAVNSWRRSDGCVECMRVVLVAALADAYVGAFCDNCEARLATTPEPLTVCSSCEGEATNTLGLPCEDCGGAGLVELSDGEPVPYGEGRLRAGAHAPPAGVGQRDVADYLAHRMDADGEAVERPAPVRCAAALATDEVDEAVA